VFIGFHPWQTLNWYSSTSVSAISAPRWLYFSFFQAAFDYNLNRRFPRIFLRSEFPGSERYFQMNDRERATPSDFLLPLLLLLFVGSGCAALIYEIVWFQMLQLVLGATAVSLGVLLGTFMGGMCLGSVFLPRLIPEKWHPLRIYAGLELCIGIIGIGVLNGMPMVSRIYTAHFAPGLAGFIVRGLAAAICLLPPTLLMGATLPAIARWVRATPRGVSWLGFFYGGNTIGAAFGCILAGFYLLRVYDVAVATYCAAAINTGVAILALAIAPFAARSSADAVQISYEFPIKASTAWMVYLAIALSGMSALGAEVVWTRLLSLLLGGTVYTFSIILAVLLVGLVIGSAAGATIARESRNPRRALGWCQILLIGAIAWAARAILVELPGWPINAHLGQGSVNLFEVDLMRCAFAILPATCLWGASFPLALAGVAARGSETGRLVGGVYAANTLGAIFGAILFSLAAIPLWGTQESQRILIGICGLAALLALTPTISLGAVFKLAMCVALVWLLARTVAPLPWKLVAYGRDVAVDDFAQRALYVGEGINSTVAVTEDSAGERYFHVAGKVEASTLPADMRLQLMLGHIPELLHPEARSVLIVGCGAGVTAGTFRLYPQIQKITICEIEPLIPKNVTHFFEPQNQAIMLDPRLTLMYDDARHFVLTTHEKFDIITSDPIHPWVKGAASLYTREYFQMVKDHLNPHGLVTQWVPLYETDEKTVKSEVATFFQVFPNGVIWANDDNGSGYDVVMLGSADPELKIDVDALQRTMDDSNNAVAMAVLGTVNFENAEDLLRTFAGQASDFHGWLADAEINTDRNLRLQYVAGLANNLQLADLIYQDMLARRKFPENVFSGNGQVIDRLRVAMSGK